MAYVRDALDDFLRHDAEQEKRIARLPVCVYCGEPIQDEDCIDLDGEQFHIECFMNEHKKETSSLIY